MKHAFCRSFGKKIVLLALVAVLLIGMVAAAGITVNGTQVSLFNLHANTANVIVAGYSANGQMLFAKVQPASQTSVTVDLSQTAYLRVFETNSAYQPTREVTVINLGVDEIQNAQQFLDALKNGGTYYIPAMKEFQVMDPVTISNDVSFLLSDSVSLASLDEEIGLQDPENAVVTFSNTLTIASGKTLTIGEGLEFHCTSVVNNGTVDVSGSFVYDSMTGTGTVTSANYLLSDILVEGYTVDFNPDVLHYYVNIPAGRSIVPEVSATPLEGVEVSVAQAAMPDSVTTASAVITATKGAKTIRYTVHFTRDEAQGFQLQYDDYYSFAPEANRYDISNTSVIELSTDKKLHAKALSAQPVTVTAYNSAGQVVDTLTITEVIKAPINIFLIVGQSNAYGTYDVPGGQDSGTFYQNQIDRYCIKPQKGTVLCADVHWDGTYYGRSSSANPMYDLSVGRAGFSPALGKEWYDLTGEKSLMIQTAVGGSPIEAWEKPEGGVRNTYADYAKGNFYETTKKALTECRAKLDAPNSGYVVNRIHAYWVQGETGMTGTYDRATAGWDFANKDGILNANQYYSKFLKNMDYFENEFGVSFMGIILVRCVQEVASPESNELQLLTDLVGPRAAQYALNNTTGTDISLVSRVCDIARMESYRDSSVEGWGYMGVGNLHYNQIGHNANGISAAQKTFDIVLKNTPATDIEVIKSNGRDRFADDEVLEIMAGSTYQTAAMALPEGTAQQKISYEVADESVCTIDHCGIIYANENAIGKSTTITFKVDGTDIEKTITVEVCGIGKVTVSYEWNFDNDDLTEKDGKNDLHLSAKTGDNADYSITNGIYTAKNQNTNFRMDKPIPISDEYDFTIEWRSQLTAASCLFGTANSGNHFMYLAYPVYADANEWNHPLRIVDADGDILTIPYGKFAARNEERMLTWKLDYVESTGIATFYCKEDGGNYQVVGSAQIPDNFSLTFTNLFGSYVSGTDVDLRGSVDFVRITTSYNDLIHNEH